MAVNELISELPGGRWLCDFPPLSLCLEISTQKELWPSSRWWLRFLGHYLHVKGQEDFNFQREMKGIQNGNCSYFFFFIAIVLMVLSHGFCRCIFLLKTRVVCVFLTSCQPENPLGGQLHLSLSTRLGNGKKKTQFHSSIQILIIRWLKRITFICQLSAIAVLEVLCC